MGKSISEELFLRISHLFNTLKLETINFVNTVSSDDKDESDSESDSVILIETPEVENQFIELLRGNISELNSLRDEINETCQKKCVNITLEHLVNISVLLHISIENLIEELCTKFSIEKDQVNS